MRQRRAADVAARGIDLPGLELVIHADLPTNSATLLHRSGRTGRAGAKGVSALIVTPAEDKKAQRLLQGARVIAAWGRPPLADGVTARDNLRMLEHPALTTTLDDMAPARALLAQVGPQQSAAAFVQLWREGRPPPEDLFDVVGPGEAPAPRAPRECGASVRFELSVGHAGRAEARWLLPKICDAGGITRDAIGAIRVRDHQTHVQIAVEHAARFGSETEIEPGLTLRRLQGEPPAKGAASVQAGPPKRPQPRPPASPAPHVPVAIAVSEPPTFGPEKAEDTGLPAKPAKPRWSKAQKEAKTGPSRSTAAMHGQLAPAASADGPLAGVATTRLSDDRYQNAVGLRPCDRHDLEAHFGPDRRSRAGGVAGGHLPDDGLRPTSTRPRDWRCSLLTLLALVTRKDSARGSG